MPVHNGYRDNVPVSRTASASIRGGTVPGVDDRRAGDVGAEQDAYVRGEIDIKQLGAGARVRARYNRRPGHGEDATGLFGRVSGPAQDRRWPRRRSPRSQCPIPTPCRAGSPTPPRCAPAALRERRKAATDRSTKNFAALESSSTCGTATGRPTVAPNGAAARPCSRRYGPLGGADACGNDPVRGRLR